MNMERNYYIEDYRELSDYIDGSRGRFLHETNENKTIRRNHHLYNEVAKQSLSVMSAGMMAGITSPARPWFKLAPPDPDMADYEPVKIWLDDVQRTLLAIYQRSNFYNSMQNVYTELGAFGVAPMGAYENYDNVMRFEPYTVGSYSLASNGERQVDTLSREYRLSVGQIVKQFGYKSASRAIRNMYDKGDYEDKVTIIHLIEPNDSRKYDSPLAKDMMYRSVYFEEQCDGDNHLKYSGFEDRPFMAPRWSAIGEDTYSTSYPGIDSLNSNKSLQIEELDYAIAREKMHNPPLIGDAMLKQDGTDLIAGGITYLPNMAQSGKPGLTPVYTVNPQVQALVESIREKENRIQRFFYADLFLMITEMDRAQITATEIAERKEEKMLMLGPVLERLNNELFDPLIDRTFAVAQRAGILPPPPKELVDADLKVEYISVLAQAQRAVSTAGIESTVGFAANLANVWPEARHKVDPLQAIDEYAKAKGASPKIIKSDKDAMASDEAEKQQAAQLQSMEAASQMANDAKTLSETDASNQDSALAAIAGGLQ